MKTVFSIRLVEQRKKKAFRNENQYGSVGCNFHVVVRGGLIETVIFKIFKQRLEFENTRGGGRSSISFIMRKVVFTYIS